MEIPVLLQGETRNVSFTCEKIGLRNKQMKVNLGRSHQAGKCLLSFGYYMILLQLHVQLLKLSMCFVRIVCHLLVNTKQTAIHIN